MLRLAFVVSSLFVSLPGQQPSVFRPSPLFGDHMVLPAASQVPVHGDGQPGAKVTVQPSWASPVETTVRGDGRWQVALTTPARGRQGSLLLRSGDVQFACNDVLFGDVWLASGQSNMEMPIGQTGGWLGVDDWQQEVATADWPQLRVFKTSRQMSPLPATHVDGSWVVCSPATAASLSATGYFFARELLRAGKGPIGLVDSSWGGTRAEAWTSAAGLSAFPEFQGALQANRLGADEALRAVQRAAFWRAIDDAVPNATAVPVTVPERWSTGELRDFDGCVEYTRSLMLPPAFVGQPLSLQLGAIDDMDTVFWNGERIAGSERDGVWAVERRYRVPAAVTAKAEVELRVRVVDTGGEGGFAGKVDELRLVLVDAPDAGPAGSLPLAGTWQRRLHAGLAGLPEWPRGNGSANRPAVLWNGMIEPLLPFPFTGAIWYQGEANRDAPDQYAKLFVAMIRDWRRALGEQLPFYFVQIAPFGYQKDADDLTARLRAAQAAALALPGTGMVVTLDCGDAKDIHPGQKQPVGRRLAALALADVYGEPGRHRSARAIAARQAGKVVRVRFADAGDLRLVGKGTGFEIGDGSGHFVRAAAEVDGDELVLAVPTGVAAPSVVRYAWRAVPACSLVDAAGLPAAPFLLSIQ